MRRYRLLPDGTVTRVPVVGSVRPEAEVGRLIARAEAGSVWVSTVFLGIDHATGGEAVPVLFETMVFVGESSTGTVRQARTVREALACHRAACAEAFPETVTPTLTFSDVARAVSARVD